MPPPLQRELSIRAAAPRRSVARFGDDASEDRMLRVPVGFKATEEEHRAKDDEYRALLGLPAHNAPATEAEDMLPPLAETERVLQLATRLERSGKLSTDEPLLGASRAHGLFFGIKRCRDASNACGERRAAPRQRRRRGGNARATGQVNDDDNGREAETPVNRLVVVTSGPTQLDLGSEPSTAMAESGSSTANDADELNVSVVARDDAVPVPNDEGLVADGEAEQAVDADDNAAATTRRLVDEGTTDVARCTGDDNGRPDETLTNELLLMPSAPALAPAESVPATEMAASSSSATNNSGTLGVDMEASGDAISLASDDEVYFGVAAEHNAQLNTNGNEMGQLAGGGVNDELVSGDSGGDGTLQAEHEAVVDEEQLLEWAEEAQETSGAVNESAATPFKVNEFLRLSIELRQKVLDSREFTYVGVLSASSGKGKHRVGIFYAGPTGMAQRRTLAVCFTLSKADAKDSTRLGCVRFSLNGNSDFVVAPPMLSDLDIGCSCTPLSSECPHIAFLRTNPVLMNEVLSIIEIEGGRRLLGPANAEWISILVGERLNQKEATWIVYRRCPLRKNRGVDFIPVIESWTGRRNGVGGTRKLGCTFDDRSAWNRGSCIHEKTVRKTVTALDEEGDQPSSSQNRSGGGTARAALFRSKLPRRPIPCPSEQAATHALMSSITYFMNWRYFAGQVDANGNGLEIQDRLDFVGFDSKRICANCNFAIECDGANTNASATNIRRLLLHTLLCGTTLIGVTDLQCPRCAQWCFYDGRDDALYVHNTNNALTRELLDTWVLHLAALGGTFREAFQGCLAVADSNSCSFLRRGGNPLSLSRRLANSAFTSYLQLIRFPKGNHLTKVFSCDTCEKEGESGQRIVRAIVMDGTATGVVGKLPNFRRPTIHVEPAERTGPDQHLIARKGLREYLYSLLKTAGREQSEKSFVFKLPASTIAPVVKEALFDESAGEGRLVRFEIKLLFETMFSAPNLENALSSRSAGANSPTTTVRFTQRLKLPSLCSALADFAASHLYESVPIALIQSKRHEEAAFNCIAALKVFRCCQHLNETTSRMLEGVCDTCVNVVVETCKGDNLVLGSATRVMLELCEAQCEGDNSPLKTIAYLVENMLRRCIEVRKEFLEVFEARQHHSARYYNSEFENVATNSSNHPPNVSNSSDDCFLPIGLSEAALEGDIFPGRPLLRKRVMFKNKNTGEDWREECTKEYPNHHSHSPGLFTVQCSCEHPKLFGVSIMEEAESISTAVNAMATRFNPLPKVVFYDNACNMAQSVALRFSWMFSQTTLLCDRFHYGHHKCSCSFDPDTYRLADNVQTSGAEALNKQWKASRTHIRFLNADNVVPFIYLRMLFINLKAHLRDAGDIQDVDEKDLYGFANKLEPCQCFKCSKRS